MVQLLKGPGNENKKAEPELIAEHSINKKNKKAILFKIEVLDDKYHFYYALNKKEWILLKADVDAKFLSTKTAGGFVGCFYALYATSEGKSSTNTAQYQWFESRSNDDVYKPK